MENIIVANKLTKDYGKGRGIFDFSFTVEKGQVVGLVGSNGSGKTTTIRQLMGFLKSTSGNAQICGMSCWKDSVKLKRLIGYVPGQIDFPDVGNGTSFLKIQAELMGMHDYSLMNELIDRFKIDTSAPLKTMSKGMKQKMALVAAFMAQPEVYLLDEPSTGLDPLMRDTLIELILEQKAKGRTVFMSSHIFKELEDTCDKVIFIHKGHLVAQVDRAQFEADPRERYVVRFSSAEEFRRYTSRKAPTSNADEFFIAKNAVRNSVELSIPQQELGAFLADLTGYDVHSLQNEAYSLERYYSDYIESEA